MMKRSLLAAALALSFTPCVWASVTTDNALLAQQIQQTALLSSINAKLATPGDFTLPAAMAQNQNVQNTQQQKDLGNLLVNGDVQAPVGAAAAQVVVTIDVIPNGGAHGKDQAHYDILASNGRPTHMFSGESVPYVSSTTDALDENGKPIPPTVRKLDIGTTIDLTPRVNGDVTTLTLHMARRTLISMPTISTDNGQHVDLPSVTLSEQTQEFALKVGQAMTMSSFTGPASADRIVVRLKSVTVDQAQAAR